VYIAIISVLKQQHKKMLIKKTGFILPFLLKGALLKAQASMCAGLSHASATSELLTIVRPKKVMSFDSKNKVQVF
jgi:hypothetical protein